MSDQNNNNPNQPPQGQPPYQPYQGQPPQGEQPPYQPYQGQPPQGGQPPYQPYQGQPPQGGQPPYQPYQGQPPYQQYNPYGQPPKKKSKWWIWLIVAAVVILAVVALFVFGVIDLGGGVKRIGNEAAWKTYDYFDQAEDKLESIKSPVYKEIADRFKSEAFEAEGEFDIKADELDITSFGFGRFGAEFMVKYDLKDLGVKLEMFDTITADIYLIEEDLVISVMGEAYAMPLDPDTDVDLEDEMGLEDRMKALSSLSADEEFGDLIERLMAELAPAVPDDLTETDTVDVYSPLEDDEVEMKATVTTLEKEDIYDIIVAFGENLEENEELAEDLQTFAESLSMASGEDIDIDDMIEEMVELDEDELEEFEDVTLEWSIYEYKGDIVGLGIYYEMDEEEVELFIITEYTKDTQYTSVIVNVDGDEAANVLSQITYDDELMTVDMEIEINEPGDEYTEPQEITVSISGETVLEKGSSSEYEYSGEFNIEMDMGDSMYGMESEGSTEIDIEIVADVEFGDDLGTLEDDDDWNEVYDMDWGDIEDIFDSLGGFGGFGGFGDFDVDIMDEFSF